MTTYPNARCACGYTRFRENVQITRQDVQRWVQFTATTGGMGSTPFGSYFGGHGGSPSGDWGLFDGTMVETALIKACEACKRQRYRKLLGTFTLFGSYVVGRTLYVVGSDLSHPVGCYQIRLVGQDGETYDLPLTWVGMLPAPLSASTPAVVSSTTPPADRAEDLLMSEIPDVLATQTFEIYFVDTCADTSELIATINLETPPMIFSPLDADLCGAPPAWLYGSRGRPSSAQPASGSRLSIPFDKPLGVIEYQPRAGTLPAAQGFTHSGTGAPGDFVLVPGGGLLATIAPSATSSWLKTLALSANPQEAYAYMRINPIVESPDDGSIGMTLDARYSQSVSTPYRGMRLNRRDQNWFFVALTDGTATSIRGVARGWSQICAYANDAGEDQGWLDHDILDLTSLTSGTSGVAAAVEGRLVFGDPGGSSGGSETVIDGVVASFGGRFLRARFVGVAPTSTPVLRLYGYADANASANKTVRFKVRYAAHGADPFSQEASVVEATLNAVSANAMYEVALSLTGLSPLQPFTFMIERDIGHVDDKLEATFHVSHLTVRSS